ncbi:hypothetical protein DVR12_12665 [Chitinophaga silvatica]|uniref:Uncharacterized protein n=1 Tax=Chitinophaga silvatica TaxID=2282649 RepID=A0A3E1YA94_9BACT|nr:hypothetical protein [Chitinophaga silvatica]RFS22643.1 hypothetical protein DVR12_12665 [Chitinophaga silvatica]
MNFGFKLFRITNTLALTLSGMSVFSSISAFLVAGFSPEVILPLLASGACFIHSILSMYLQRNWLMPEMPLKESTPSGVRIMGVIELIFAFICIFIGISILLVPNHMLNDMITQMKQQQEAFSILTPGVIKRFGAFTLFIGILFTVNVILSFRLLKRIQQRQSHNESQDQQPQE